MELFKINDSLLASKIQALHKEHRDQYASWRQEAREGFDFVAGNQWNDADKAKLEEQGRPLITFNRCNTIISAVMGMEANQRQETSYLPRDNNDAGLADAVDSVAEWCEDYADMEYEDAEAFEDLVTVGMGWTETRIDYDVDLDGKIVRDCVSPLDMSWDTNARKKNLSDAEWVCRARRMDIETIKEQWPKAEDISVDAIFDDDDHDSDVTVVDREKSYSDNDQGQEKSKKPIVLQFQWYECEPIYRVENPDDGQIATLTVEEYKKNKDIIAAKNAIFVRQLRRRYYQAFVVGDYVLEKEESGCQTGFTFKCITGKRDKVNREWFGLFRLMRDPQKWTNRFFSQIIDIIDSNAKGGVIAEEGAVTDVRAFEDSWAKADSITWVRPGSIAGGKIMNRPVAQYPQGLDRLMQFSVSGIYEVTGINLEMLGMVDRSQAGIVEESRKRSGYTILATFFDALRQYRKSAGMTMLEYIKNYVPLSRIEEVLEDDLKQYAKSIKEIDLMRVNVTVTESPQSDNNKMMTWAFISQIVPSLLQFGIPVPPEILEYSPLPATLAEKWKKMIEEGQNKDPMQDMMKQLAVKEKMGQIDKTQSEAEKNRTQAQKNLADVGLSGAKAQHETISGQQKVVETLQGRNVYGQ